MSSLVSEDALLSAIDRHFDFTGSSIRLGRGDDCAILASSGTICVSSDLFLQDVHFRTSYFSPAEIGHKALAVNLGDLAAMGARPLAFSLCLGLPPQTGMPWLEEMLDGMSALAGRHDLALCGGDLSSADKIHISITIFGEKQANSCLLTRDTCRPGDTLFVTGRLGLARVGLAMLEKMGRQALDDWPQACMAHLRPWPDIAAGAAISRYAQAAHLPALMDVSDGICRDLPRMLNASSAKAGVRLGAELDFEQAMLAPDVLRYADENGLDPVRLALAGGEDYVLLGACAPRLLPDLLKAVPGLYPIGRVTGRDTGHEPLLECNGRPILAESGFDHFRE